jgi:hypothetical protein
MLQLRGINTSRVAVPFLVCFLFLFFLRPERDKLRLLLAEQILIDHRLDYQLTMMIIRRHLYRVGRDYKSFFLINDRAAAFEQEFRLNLNLKPVLELPRQPQNCRSIRQMTKFSILSRPLHMLPLCDLHRRVMLDCFQ